MSAYPRLFSLFKNNENIEEGISQEFIEILQKCKSPHIICIYGAARIGKSTKMNQIIKGTISENYFNLETPFQILKEIHTTMTKGCNFYGPVKIRDIANKNNFDVNEIDKEIIDDELFFVDTEGFNSLDNSTNSCACGILTILQIAVIKILYIPFLDNEKLDNIVKTSKLSNILNMIINDSQIIVLLRDVPLSEKEENKMLIELDQQRDKFENKINNYIQKLDGNTKTICEILPSYDLASSNIEPYSICYKSQMEKLVCSILINIKRNKNMNGQKFIYIINEFLKIFKKVKDIGLMKNTEKALNLVLSEIFKEKSKKVYLDICKKIKEFNYNIISLNGKPESIKSYLEENLKKELKNIWEIYYKIIRDDINEYLRIFSLKIEQDIKSNINKVKAEIKEEINAIININNNKEIMNYFSKINFKEEVDNAIINNIIEKIINSFLGKYTAFFEYMEKINKEYRKSKIDYIKNNLINKINYITESKQLWRNYLRKIIYDIEKNISTPYKNELKAKSLKEIKENLKNNLNSLDIKIQIYLAEKNINIYNYNEMHNEINKLYEEIKEDLNNQIKIIENNINKERLEKEKLSTKTIPDGIYMIYPAHCQDKVIDIRFQSRENNANVQIFQIHHYNSQKFLIEYNKEKRYYTMKNINSEKYINLEPNGNINQSERNYSDNQKWHIVSCGNNYEIVSELNGKYMDVSGAGVCDDTNVFTWERNGGLNQQFRFVFTTKSPPYIVPPPAYREFYSIFEPYFYSQRYEDLRRAFGNNRDQLYNHFKTYGIKEGRCASQAFDVSYYVERNQDLKNAFGSNYVAALNHFKHHYAERRDLSPVFDLGYYMDNNPDVVKECGDNYDKIMKHFLIHGMKEGRISSPNFNINAYKSYYQDLRNAFGENNKEYYSHYCNYGRNEGRKAI